MSNLNRSNTLKSLKRMGSVSLRRAGTEVRRAGTGLKRAGTGLKRAGTGAWKWINAEDVEINENQPPVGHTFFQRSDTYKRMNRKLQSGRNLEEGVNANKSPLVNSSEIPSNNNELSSSSLLNSQSQSQSPSQTQSQSQSQSQLQTPIQYDSSETLNNSGFFARQSKENLYKDNEAYKYQQEDNISKVQEPKDTRRKIERNKKKDENRKSKVPKALYDPEVRKQLEELKQHKPYFIYTVTIIQVFMMILSLIVNYKYTGNVVESMNTNVMIGPSSGALIHLGARFVPCMKKMDDDRAATYNKTICPPGVKGSLPPEGSIENVCSLSDLCGMGGFDEGKEPNQWSRFILPIFLHAGIIHLFVNLIFQIRTGLQMEKDFGTWRIVIIYMLSGIFGFGFGADINYNVISVGCSGALYGLLACLLLDLIQNWKLIVNPWIELIKMSTIIIFSLGIGLLPYIDNYAHVGGFITGILTGLIFMPTIIFGKWDLRRKRLLKVISIPILIGIFIWVFKNFYAEDPSECSWCKYVSCIPINNWCDATVTTTTTSSSN